VVDPADPGDEKVHLNVPRLEGGGMGLEPVDLGPCKVVDLVERVHSGVFRLGCSTWELETAGLDPSKVAGPADPGGGRVGRNVPRLAAGRLHPCEEVGPDRLEVQRLR
jgi:hypothetical protein